MLYGHGGNIDEAAKEAGCEPSEIIDFSNNIGPLPPHGEVMDALKERLGEIRLLPQAGSETLSRLLADKYGLSPGQVLVGNGSTELIFAIPARLRPKRSLILAPTYSDYSYACCLASSEVDYLMCEQKRGFAPDLNQLKQRASGADMAFICNPNNPTGALIPGDELKRLARESPSCLFVVDESYLPFVEGEETYTMLSDRIPNNLIALRSFSKINAVPGLRLGWLAGSEKTVAALRKGTPPWSVNRLAQVMGETLLNYNDTAKGTARYISGERERILLEVESRLLKSGGTPPLAVYPSSANFLLFELKGGRIAPELRRKLLKKKILIRDCSNFKGLSDRFFRVSVKGRDMNALFLEALWEALAQHIQRP